MPGRFSWGFDRFSGIYLWATFVVIFGTLAPSTFLSVTTVQVIAAQQSVAVIISIALLAPLVVGEFDLSVGAMANFSGILATVLMTNGTGVFTAMALAVLAGVLVGVVNGYVTVQVGVNSFIATLGMASVLSALTAIVTNSQMPQPYVDPVWTNLTQTKIFGFQSIVIFPIIIAIFAWWVLAKTPVGRRMYATGANSDAARLSGLRTKRIAWTSLVFSATLASVGGILFTSLTGPSLTFGATLLLPAFAACFLGSTQLMPGRFNVGGTILAIIVLATGVAGLQLVTGVQWVKNMFDGVALILAVALSVTQQKRKTTQGIRRRRKREASSADTNMGADEALHERVSP